MKKITALCILIFPPICERAHKSRLNGRAADAARAPLSREAG